MGLTFHAYRDSSSAWCGTLYGKGNRVIADGCEGYGNWQESVDAVNLVQSEVGAAEVWNVSCCKHALIRVAPAETGFQLRDDSLRPPRIGGNQRQEK
jgi:uncharacterized protein YegP (UPF0339 family)